MLKFIAASGSCHDPNYKIDGHITHHVKDINRKYFMSAEFVHELYTEDFWTHLAEFAKKHNKYIELYAEQ